MKCINLVTLPRTCFAVAPLDYPCNDTTLKIEKFALADDDVWTNSFEETVPNIEEIVNDPENTLYVNLDVKKYLLTNAQLKSGKVQGLACSYYIYTYQDSHAICVMKVGDLINNLQIEDYIHDHENYNRAKEYLQHAIDFELIEETDYVRMTYRTPNSRNWRDSTGYWHIGTNHQKIDVRQIIGMNYPSNKKIIHLIDVLKYSNNNELTKAQCDKIKMLLQNSDTEKVALTILNSINPDKSFVELLCIINHMDSRIAKNNPNVPILPLLNGAYNADTRTVRTADNIVKQYTKVIGKPNNDVLERIADSYWHPRNEKSSIFDFKLKLKRK
jgi:hypothetical protein